MAADKPSITESKRGPLKFALLSTRLKKIKIDSLPPPKADGGGNLVLNYAIAVEPNNPPGTVEISLQIVGDGEDKDDPELIPFTIDAEISGLFSITRKPTKAEVKNIPPELANYILPILTDTIETLLTKCGYTNIILLKSLPEEGQITDGV